MPDERPLAPSGAGLASTWLLVLVLTGVHTHAPVFEQAVFAAVMHTADGQPTAAAAQFDNTQVR
jgi:hypothetical protein